MAVEGEVVVVVVVVEGEEVVGAAAVLLSGGGRTAAAAVEVSSVRGGLLLAPDTADCELVTVRLEYPESLAASITTGAGRAARCEAEWRVSGRISWASSSYSSQNAARGTLPDMARGNGVFLRVCMCAYMCVWGCIVCVFFSGTVDFCMFDSGWILTDVVVLQRPDSQQHHHDDVNLSQSSCIAVRDIEVLAVVLVVVVLVIVVDMVSIRMSTRRREEENQIQQ